jgi:hypothetical protein
MAPFRCAAGVYLKLVYETAVCATYSRKLLVANALQRAPSLKRNDQLITGRRNSLKLGRSVPISATKQ